jgi:NADH-quinone oxidoreductase subunit L
MAPIFILSPFAMFVMATVGAVTAVFAATIAFAQRDIKKVLAYSTVSQLGYMFLGVGVGAFTAGFFHVVTHAFFKACLFLGAGSVIHAMHARIHDTGAAQDMNNMGGLRRYLPITFATFVAASAAIVGVPFTSGFFSKDEILFQSFTLSVASPIQNGILDTANGRMKIFVSPPWVSSVLLSLGTLGAVMTAFYMTRLVVGIFFGNFRGWAIPASSINAQPTSERDSHTNHVTESDSAAKGPAPRESPWAMTVPLVFLGLFALGAGAFNATAFFHFTPLDHFLETSIGKFENIKSQPNSEQLEQWLLLPGILAFIVGTAWAGWVYVAANGQPAQRFAQRYPRFYQLVYDKWRIDEFYRETIVGTLELIADICVWFDKWIVDGILARVTSLLVAITGSCVRLFQTGRVHTYAAFIVLGLGFVGWFMTTPHAEAAISSNHELGKYTITAEPGLGYSYRWDSNGDGQFEASSFSDQSSIAVGLDRTERRTIILQVRDAFGREATRKFKLERPAEDQSRPRITQVSHLGDAVDQPPDIAVPNRNDSNVPSYVIRPGQLP